MGRAGGRGWEEIIHHFEVWSTFNIPAKLRPWPRSGGSGLDFPHFCPLMLEVDVLQINKEPMEGTAPAGSVPDPAPAKPAEAGGVWAGIGGQAGTGVQAGERWEMLIDANGPTAHPSTHPWNSPSPPSPKARFWCLSCSLCPLLYSSFVLLLGKSSPLHCNRQQTPLFPSSTP